MIIYLHFTISDIQLATLNFFTLYKRLIHISRLRKSPLMFTAALKVPACSFWQSTYSIYPKKYAHGFCFAVLCCGYTLTDFPISIRLTSLALWQSNDCPSASKATLMNMDKYFMWIHYERLHNHYKAKHNKTVCIFLIMRSFSALLAIREGNSPASRVFSSKRASCVDH